MTETTSTTGLIQLRHQINNSVECIPTDLVDQVIRALPDNAPTRLLLQGWRNTTDRIILSVSHLQSLERDLVVYAHRSPNRLGMIGRLSKGSAGKIMSGRDEDAAVSAIVVLALSIRRLITLHGVGIELSVLVQDDSRRTV